ncbi:MAG: hypothetical protein R3B90_21730 [Planctomycetaceae bacterium]
MIGARTRTATITPQPLLRAADRAARRVMMRIGGFIRLTASRSLRKRKGVSRPDGPPHSHGPTLRRNILWSYDPTARSVIVGPRALPGKAGSLRHLEHGGAAPIVNNGRRVRANFAARPFMRPALQAEAPKLPQMWRDQLNR